MFETAAFSYDPSSKRVWTTAMGFTGQAVLIGCLMLAPLVSPQTLGRAFLVTGLVAPGAPPAPAAPTPRVEPVPHHGALAPATHALVEPVAARVPMVAAMIVDAPEAYAPVPSCPSCVVGGDPNSPPSNGSRIIGDIVGMVPVVQIGRAS